jgi:uncharacterized membrane protein
MVLGFFAVSVYAGVISYTDFQTQNSTDAGIITQAVTSTTFGHNPPFFESYDCMVKTRCSFLLVHPAFVLYGAVPFFALFPSTITLFVLRSAIVALTAIPLYVLTRRVTGSSGKALLAAGLFLIWAPGFLGDAFSLHLETVLPIEIISLAALWVYGRYRWGLLVALLAFLTMEVGPVFVFLVGAFFLVPYFDKVVRPAWQRWRSGHPRPGGLRQLWQRGVATARAGWAIREVRYTVLLMGLSVAAYVTLLSFMNIWGPTALGVITPSVPAGVKGVFYDNSTPATAGIFTVLTSSQTVYTAEYWLIVYATLAFLPLLSPRALVLSVPWIGWTFLSDSSRFTTLGHEYSMVAAGPLFIGLAYGLQRVEFPAWLTAAFAPARAAPPPAPYAAPARRARWSRRLGPLWVGAIGVVIVANVMLSPINPALSDLGVALNAPFQPDYFDHSLVYNPAYGYLSNLVGKIPNGATVTASAPLFPLLATRPHAYVLLPPDRFNVSNLPFAASSNPDYVLLTTNSIGPASSFLRANLSQPALYGLRGYVASSDVGAIVLYALGYNGTTQAFGPALPAVNASYLAGSGLSTGPIGTIVRNSTTPMGGVVASVPGTPHGGLVATSPEVFLPAGAYTVSVVVHAWAVSPALTPSDPVLRVFATGIAPILINTTFSAGQILAPGWLTEQWNLTLSNPVPNVELQTFLETKLAAVELLSVTIAPRA